MSPSSPSTSQPEMYKDPSSFASAFRHLQTYHPETADNPHLITASLILNYDTSPFPFLVNYVLH